MFKLSKAFIVAVAVLSFGFAARFAQAEPITAFGPGAPLNGAQQPDAAIAGYPAAPAVGAAGDMGQASGIEAPEGPWQATGTAAPFEAGVAKAATTAHETFGLDVFSSASPVPEPASLMLFGSGLTIVGSVIRKRVVKP